MNETVPDGIVVCDTYKLFRKDRDPFSSSKSRGGGVFIAVKTHIQADELPVRHFDAEHVFVKLKYYNEIMVVCCVYIPPNSPLSLYEKHLDDLRVIAAKFSESKLVVVGDFNMPNLVFNPNSPGDIDSGGDTASELLDELAVLGLVQYNAVRNSHGRLLDLCFANFGLLVT